jgi:hypothetical protein
VAENKTKPSDADVEVFLASIADDQRRQDCRTLVELMREATGSAPRLWGTNIIGFGDQHYRYASGREGDWFVVGFAPRKQNLTLYLSYGVEQHADLLGRLGKHSLGKACLYVKRLADVDLATLRELLDRSLEQTRSENAVSGQPPAASAEP